MIPGKIFEQVRHHRCRKGRDSLNTPFVLQPCEGDGTALLFFKLSVILYRSTTDEEPRMARSKVIIIKRLSTFERDIGLRCHTRWDCAPKGRLYQATDSYQMTRMEKSTHICFGHSRHFASWPLIWIYSLILRWPNT